MSQIGYYEDIPLPAEEKSPYPEKLPNYSAPVTFLAHPAIAEEPPKKKTRLKKLSDIFHEFAGDTTAHGIPRIIERPHIISKLFWFIIVCVCFGVFGMQAVNILNDYYTYNTNIELITKKNVRFPAVTVCNLNRMKRSQMINTRFEGLVNIDGGFTNADGDADYSWFFDFSSNLQWWDYSSSISSSVGGSSSGGASSSGGGGGGGSSSSGGGGGGGSSSSSGGSASRKKRDIPNLTRQQVRRKKELEKLRAKKQKGGPKYKKALSKEERDKRGAYSSYSYAYDGWFDGANYGDDFTFEYYNYYDWGGITDENDWAGFYAQSTSEDYSDIIDVANPTLEELGAFGHLAEDFILQCTFDKRPCNYTDFNVFQNQQFGNCFTFNGVTKQQNDSDIRNSTKAGSQYGLHLTLFIEQPEYIGLFTHESGVRVAVHPHNVLPTPEDLGISCSTGVSTSIGLRQTEIIRLGGLYGDCTTGDDKEFLLAGNYSYTVLACSKKCLYDQMQSNCGCITDIISDASEVTKCSYLNSTQQRCRRLIESLYNENLLECDCPPPCREIVYSTVTSTTLWPSERYEEHLYSRVSQSNPQAARILQNVEVTRKNLARVKIYFEELNYQLIEQVEAYTIESLLGSVGGLMGLYVGISTITLAEMIIFVLDVIFFCFKKVCCKSSIKPIEVPT